MGNKFEPLNDDEVVCVPDFHKTFYLESMFKAGNLVTAVKLQLARRLLNNREITVDAAVYKQVENWVNEGVYCETMKFDAKGWQKGKVKLKVTLEFCPDEPEFAEILASNEPEIAQRESPLDDIRRLINENSHQDNL